MVTRLAIILFACVLSGCTRAVTSTVVTWSQPDTAATTAQAYYYRLYVTPPDAATLAPAHLDNVACSGTPTACNAPLPASMVQAISTGAKSEITAAVDAQGTESARSDPFVSMVSCTYKGITYSVGQEMIETTSRGSVQSVISSMEAAGLDVIEVAKLSGNRYRLIGRCVGPGNTTAAVARRKLIDNAKEVADDVGPVPDPATAPPIVYTDKR